MFISSKACCVTVLENLNLQDCPKQTGSWRAVQPKKRKEEKFHQLLKNDIKFADKQESKTIQILSVSDIFKEKMIFPQEKRLVLDSWIRSKGKDHITDIQATKEFTNVISVLLPIILRNREEGVIYQKNRGG